MQFYNVEVRVLPPEGKGAPKVRSVLRRYNHFTKLYAKVCSDKHVKLDLTREALHYANPAVQNGLATRSLGTAVY